MNDLFTTTPQSVQFTNGHSFIDEVRRIVRESEEYGFKGTLIYSDNRLAEPWEVCNVLLNETHKLLPMIALQPVYMHPYTVAKKISTIALIYNRKISLNLIAGGFKNDLTSLGDHTEHDRRYDRLREYTRVIQLLLQSKKAVSFEGEFYSIKNLKLLPEMPDELQPVYYLSGSSEAARETASALGAHLIEYPEPPSTYDENTRTNSPPTGMRVGVLARETHQEAWEVARQRFPETRIGEITHQMAKKTSDSVWHQKLSGQQSNDYEEEPVYWLGPFKHYHTFCPYLVGSYEEVASEISNYMELGHDTCILDIPVSAAELAHTKNAFDLAQSQLKVS